METELVTNLTERLNGPFSLRLFLQPSMALLFALRDGRADAKAGADPYLWRIFFQHGLRRQAIVSAWASLGKVMTIAFVLDCAFQFATARSIAVGEALIMAILLCAVPYTLMRGPATRLLRYSK